MKKLITLSFILMTSFAFSQTVEYVYPETQSSNYIRPVLVNFHQGTIESALAQAKAERKLIFLDFVADWCSPCKQVEQEVFTDPQVADYINQNFISFKVHTDNFENGHSDYALKMGVKPLPTLMVINDKGSEMGRITGYKTANTYLLALRRIERYSAYRR